MPNKLCLSQCSPLVTAQTSGSVWDERVGLILRMHYVYSAMKLNTSSYKVSLIATWDAVLAARSQLSDELLHFNSINLEKLDKLSTAGILEFIRLLLEFSLETFTQSDTRKVCTCNECILIQSSSNTLSKVVTCSHV